AVVHLHPHAARGQRNGGPCKAVGVFKRSALFLQDGRVVWVVAVNITHYAHEFMSRLMDNDAGVGVQAVAEKALEIDVNLAVSEATQGASYSRLRSTWVYIADKAAIRCLSDLPLYAAENVAGSSVLVDQIDTSVEVEAERQHVLADPFEHPPSVE